MCSVKKRVKFWPSSLQSKLFELQENARDAMYQALEDAAWGLTSGMAKAHGEDKRLSGVMKIVKNAPDGNTYRGIYTVEFPEAVWVVDVYDKKSTKGISTPKPIIDRAVQRLSDIRHYRTKDPEGVKEVALLLADLQARKSAAHNRMEVHNAGDQRQRRRR